MAERLRYPILGIAPSRWNVVPTGAETLFFFYDKAEFATLRESALKRHDHEDMLVIDSKLHCWKVARVADLGVEKGGILVKVLQFVFRDRLHDIDHELVALEPMTIEQVRERVEAAVRSNPRELLAVTGDEDEGLIHRMADAVVERVHKAKSLLRVIELLENAVEIADDALEDAQVINSFRYPLLGFAPAGARAEHPGAELLDWFVDADRLSKAWPAELKNGQRQGLVVVDCDFRAWKVTSFVDRGPIGPLWSGCFGLLGSRAHRLEQQFEPLGTMTLEAVRDRVAIAMRNNHVYSAAGTLGKSIARVRKARTIPQFSKAIWY